MPRRRRLEDSELLEFARRAFVQEGFGASTRAIAQQAGVSEAVLFQRFRTKAELFFAAMVPPSPDLHAIFSAPPRSADPASRLEQVAIRTLAYFREITPVLLPLISHPGFDYEDFIGRYPDSPLNQLVGGLQTWLSVLESQRKLEAGAPEVMALATISSMASLAMFERMGVHGGLTSDLLVRKVARLIWRGGAQFA